MKKCSTCWFYCHTDGKCYEDPRSAYDVSKAWKADSNESCCAWSGDGLTAEEREDLDALVTMETK